MSIVDTWLAVIGAVTCAGCVFILFAWDAVSRWLRNGGAS